MTTIQNAGGGDWLDLPTTPVKHRGRATPQGLPWGEITDGYVAAGGQVDASVWGTVQGKVRIVGGEGMSRHRVHTWVEGDTYQEPATPTRKPAARPRRAGAVQPGPTRRLDIDLRPEVARRYNEGETITELAKHYNVATGSITFALKKMGVQTRSPKEAWGLRLAKKAAS
jgi:hypothetical protein